MRLLVIRLSALGDVVTASPVSRIVKQADPGGELVWAVEERCADVLRGNPYIDELLVLPTSRNWGKWLRAGRLDTVLGQLGQLRRGLRGRRFDAVIDFQGLLKSALIAGVARADRKLMPADATERAPWLFTEIVPRKIQDWHTSTMYVSLLEPLGIKPQSPADYQMIQPISDQAAERGAAWLKQAGLETGGYVAICPGTTRPQKMWPDEYWPELLARLHAHLGVPGLILGGPSERELAAGILGAATSPICSAVGETSIQETAALLKSARLTVAVDTGPMHMAVAVGCPTISLFGSTGPRLFTDGSPYVCLHRHFACWPCHRHPICERYECLRAIRPEDVARTARGLLDRVADEEPARGG